MNIVKTEKNRIKAVPLYNTSIRLISGLKELYIEQLDNLEDSYKRGKIPKEYVDKYIKDKIETEKKISKIYGIDSGI